MPGKRRGQGTRRAAQPSHVDLPSDSPKRKDSKVEFQGHLSHASPPITIFFRPTKKKQSLSQVDNTTVISEVDAHISKEEKHDLSTTFCDGQVKQESQLTEQGKPSADCGEIIDNVASGKESGEDDMLCSRSSTTPHKMILIPTLQSPLLSPSSALSELTLTTSPAKKGSKSRRNLNPSQTANQLVPTAAATLNCFQKPKAPNTETSQSNIRNGANGSQHKLTEYFPVRRSVRKTKKTVMEEKQRSFEEALLTCKEEGLEVHNFEGKGRGVVARRQFIKGEYVVEYAGELIKMDEAREREKSYAQDQNTGCYMYYFKYRNMQYCVDATSESNRLGRLVNHSRNGNLVTKTFTVNNIPRLVLIAKEDIQPGEEITYDYGDRSKESLKYHPWLAA